MPESRLTDDAAAVEREPERPRWRRVTPFAAILAVEVAIAAAIHAAVLSSPLAKVDGT
ncbi:MAG: hypothetical protein JST73_08045 [Actinobacteria bacterium]|nr:hypothetical protein [Actinomycetota bacterium]